MEEIEVLIKESNILIDKSLDGSIDFVDPMLKPLIKSIFNLSNEIIEKYSDEIKELFKRIICMNKSTGSWGFYYYLTQSNLSFSEELLVYGIDNEPYHNNNDSVFLCYIIVVSRKNGFEDIINLLFEKTEISRGHFFDYNDIIEKCLLLKNDLLVPMVPDKIKEQIIFVIKNSNLYNTRFKAVCIALFFDVKDITPLLIDRLSYIILSTNNDTKEYLFANKIIEIRSLSISIYYLTSSIYYKKFYDLLRLYSEGYRKDSEYKKIYFNFLKDIKTLEIF